MLHVRSNTAIQDVWGVFLRVLGDWVGGGVGGTRSHRFNSGYHDLGLLQVDYH